MNALLIIQVHPTSGERHIAFSTDPDQNSQDLLLTSGGWQDAAVFTERVCIVASKEAYEALAIGDFHTQADPAGEVEEILVGEDDALAMQRVLESRLKGGS